MGVVTVSSSAGRTPMGLNLNTRFSTVLSSTKKVSILAFKTNKTKKKLLVSPQESVCIPVEASKESPKRLQRARKSSERVQALPTAEVQAPFCILDLDFIVAAAKLENIYKLSPPSIDKDVDRVVVKRVQRRKKKIIESDEKLEKGNGGVNIVSGKKKVNRLSLGKRIELRKKKEIEASDLAQNRIIRGEDNEYEKINRLVREYSASTVTGSFDWKKMKIPPVLPSSEHTWLFKLMQPMKAILPVKKSLQKVLGREPADVELAEAMNMNVLQLRKHMKVGNAARNKLIKHNLRLILFVTKKHFQESSSMRFQDLCQAGVDGLITAVDRFEPGRKLRLSTYALFWIRHSITRSITLASFTKVSFGIESLKSEINKAKLDLLFELNRTPTEEEIVKKVGISRERYNDVKNATKTVLSLHARNPITREEYIKGLTDDKADDNRQPALLRLALDDVLDSLKPKESLVIRQRFGLDGKGSRTLGEIAGNLNISREMVRKHEVKALMKLKHPARVDYLRQYFQ